MIVNNNGNLVITKSPALRSIDKRAEHLQLIQRMIIQMDRMDLETKTKILEQAIELAFNYENR